MHKMPIGEFVTKGFPNVCVFTEHTKKAITLKTYPVYSPFCTAIVKLQPTFYNIICT